MQRVEYALTSDPDDASAFRFDRLNAFMQAMGGHAEPVGHLGYRVAALDDLAGDGVGYFDSVVSDLVRVEVLPP